MFVVVQQYNNVYIFVEQYIDKGNWKFKTKEMS